MDDHQSLRKFDVRDVDERPIGMSREEQKFLHQMAQDCWTAGQLEAAHTAMNQLVASSHGQAAELLVFCFMRANIRAELGDSRAARRDFLFTTRARPKSRLASGWYYNFLVESGNLPEANKEGLRYLRAIQDKTELSAETLAYLDTILSNFRCVPAWCRRLGDDDLEIITNRWAQLYGPNAAGFLTVPVGKA